MKKYISPLLMLVLAAFVMAPGWAQAGSGFYVSSDLGANFASSVEFSGDSNDVASHCDGLTNPGIPGCRLNQPNPDDNDFSYTGDFFQDWWTDFDRGRGILAGAAVGYSFAGQDRGGFRLELEYFYRESEYDQTSRITRAQAATKQKIDRGEFATGPHERLGSITSHNLFGNLYYDFANTGRFTPYIGVGGGFGVTDADWGSNWTRTNNKADIRAGLIADDRADLAANAVYVDNLAGSSSIAHTTFSDTLWGLQVLFGVDYALTDAVSLGLKGRYVMFDSFTGDLVWDPLRSHAPRVGPNQPVSGNMKTNDIEFFGISLNMKYHF